MSIRAAVPNDAPAIARVHVDSWRTTYRGLLPDQVLANLSLEQRQASWQRQMEAQSSDPSSGCVYVAEDIGGRVLGFASAGPEREKDSTFEGELYAIYLLQEHQGRGIGRMLTNRVVEWLRSLGHDSMRVWVLKGNPAESFYKRLGGELTEEKTIQIGGQAYLEIAYGWKDLNRFGR